MDSPCFRRMFCIGDLIEVACFSSLASMSHVVTHLSSILVGEMYKVIHVRRKEENLTMQCFSDATISLSSNVCRDLFPWASVGSFTVHFRSKYLIAEVF